MWWLTDSPGELEVDFGIRTEARPAPAAAAAAWEVLAGRDAVPHVAVTGPEDEDRVLVHVGHAVGSQYEALRAAMAAARPLPRFLASLARDGSAFRGHRERSWEGRSGNLHLSVLIREPLPVAKVGAGLSMLPAVAVVEWLAARLPAGARPEIKWVNDLLVGGRKIAGVIASSGLRGGTIDDSLFGIGLNVTVAPEIEPDVFVPGTTCLADWTRPPAIGIVTDELIGAVERQFRSLVRDGFGPSLEAYRRHCHGIGREVCVWADAPGSPLRRQPLARGVLRGIGTDLGLLIDGHPEPVTRGRLAYVDDVRRLAPGHRFAGPRETSPPQQEADGRP